MWGRGHQLEKGAFRSHHKFPHSNKNGQEGILKRTPHHFFIHKYGQMYLLMYSCVPYIANRRQHGGWSVTSERLGQEGSGHYSGKWLRSEAIHIHSILLQVQGCCCRKGEYVCLFFVILYFCNYYMFKYSIYYCGWVMNRNRLR